MNLLLWGLTLGTVGKLVLGLAVLRVHAHIIKEHKIDNVVLTALKRERFFTLFGIVLIITGYTMEILFYSGSTEFLSCVGSECAASVSALLSQ